MKFIRVGNAIGFSCTSSSDEFLASIVTVLVTLKIGATFIKEQDIFRMEETVIIGATKSVSFIANIPIFIIKDRFSRLFSSSLIQ